MAPAVRADADAARFSHAKFDKASGKQDVLAHRDAVRETVKWFREHPAPK